MEKTRLSYKAILAIILSFITVLVLPRSPVRATGLLPGLSITGNKLVDSNNNQIIFRGVNRSGTEYACIQGWGIFDGPSGNTSVQAIRSWGVNAVNVGLNEDCWLNINGVPSAYGGTNYINAIKAYVQTLESNGIYPILSLFWSAPGTQQATGQNSMPDASHSTAFWKSVATTFKDDNDVVFRLLEEPFPDGANDSTTAWNCWLNGGSACSEGYSVVGMQSLVNSIRSVGSTNVIQLSGIQYANTMTQFLTHKPTDSANNLMAVVDVYPDQNPCGNTTCYDTYYAPVIAQMPFMAGEFGESVNGNICSVTNSNILMNWLDAHNSGYDAWVWDTWGTSCGDLSLITSYNGTAKSPNGTNYKSHLASILSSTPTPVPTNTSVPTVVPTATPANTPVPTSTSTPVPTCGV